MKVFSLEEGTLAVQIARKVIEAKIMKQEPGEIDIPDSFREHGGIFTTINTYPSKNLRGCIGYPQPVMPIYKAIVESAVAAATKDNRFPRLVPLELNRVTVEVSMLTKPSPIKNADPSSYPRLVTVGKHGLIVKMKGRSGLLLPQVPVELNWNSFEFLNQTCVKAGIPAKSWMDGKTEVLTFTAEVFEEMSPGGTVKRKGLV